MTGPDARRLFRHQGRGLLRAAAVRRSDIPSVWPDPADAGCCGDWLREVWRQPHLVEAIRLAAPGLAARVDEIVAGEPVPDKQVQRATLSVVRYLLRAVGRHTPFGLFAGVAPVSVEPTAKVR
jgi:hypothetical protein